MALQNFSSSEQLWALQNILSPNYLLNLQDELSGQVTTFSLMPVIVSPLCSSVVIPLDFPTFL